MARAVAMMAAENPAEVLSQHNLRYEQGGVQLDSRLPAAARAQAEANIAANNALMRELGLGGTPATYYRDEQGTVSVHQGVPRGPDMERMMGAPRP